jgi:protease-4
MKTLERWAVAAVAGVMMAVAPALAGNGGTVAFIEIEDELAERPAPMSWLAGERETATLRGLTGLLERIASGNSYDGVVIRLKDAKLTRSNVQEVGRALARVRESGKRVHLFAEGYGPTELMLGCAADEVILQAGGAVTLPGVYIEEMYLADTLAWAGVTADMVQVGAYKGASETLARREPSPEWNQNIESLLDSLYGSMRETIKAGRRLDDAGLDEAMRRAWLAQGDEAIAAGLIDRELDWPELDAHLESVYGGDVKWRALGGKEQVKPADTNPFALLNKMMRPVEHAPKRATIAVVHIDGAIVDGDSTPGGLFGEESVGSRTIRRALAELEENELIKGVVLRINSPGGSAIASEVIWRGVRRVAAKKPVWVSVGSMAASGGYYIAVSGDRIYVNPSSIVGSIGVVGGKLALGGLMEKLKINVVGRGRGPMASMFSSTAPWTEAERAMVRERMTETYNLFAARVTQGRPGIDLSKTAEGRLFTGDRAVELKMADRIGTIDDAIADLAAELGLRDGAYDVLDYPAPKSFGELLEDMFGGFATAGAPVRGGADGGLLAQAAGVLEPLLGEAGWAQARASLRALMELRREPVLLVSPRVLIVR